LDKEKVVEASKFLSCARRHAHENPDDLPIDPEDFGACIAYLAALVGELELDETRLEVDIAAARDEKRRALAGGYRRFLKAGRPEPKPKNAPPAGAETVRVEVEPVDEGE
jgi:hypothetical protein